MYVELRSDVVSVDYEISRKLLETFQILVFNRIIKVTFFFQTAVVRVTMQVGVQSLPLTAHTQIVFLFVVRISVAVGSSVRIRIGFRTAARTIAYTVACIVSCVRHYFLRGAQRVEAGFHRLAREFYIKGNAYVVVFALAYYL